MPLHLQPIDLASELDDDDSVLFVFCPVCPPISLALQRDTPFMQPFRRGLKTEAFEEYVRSLREPLERRGVRTAVYRTYLPCPTMCLWTNGQRRRFKRRAMDFGTVVVLGCDTAYYTVAQAVSDLPCRVVKAMRTVGLTNAALRFRWPATVDFVDKTTIDSAEKAHRT